jgi:hypothetical protein
MKIFADGKESYFEKAINTIKDQIIDIGIILLLF